MLYSRPFFVVHLKYNAVYWQRLDCSLVSLFLFCKFFFFFHFFLDFTHKGWLDFLKMFPLPTGTMLNIVNRDTEGAVELEGDFLFLVLTCCPHQTSTSCSFSSAELLQLVGSPMPGYCSAQLMKHISPTSVF